MAVLHVTEDRSFLVMQQPVGASVWGLALGFFWGGGGIEGVLGTDVLACTMPCVGEPQQDGHGCKLVADLGGDRVGRLVVAAHCALHTLTTHCAHRATPKQAVLNASAPAAVRPAAVSTAAAALVSVAAAQWALRQQQQLTSNAVMRVTRISRRRCCGGLLPVRRVARSVAHAGRRLQTRILLRAAQVGWLVAPARDMPLPALRRMMLVMAMMMMMWQRSLSQLCREGGPAACCGDNVGQLGER